MPPGGALSLSSHERKNSNRQSSFVDFFASVSVRIVPTPVSVENWTLVHYLPSVYRPLWWSVTLRFAWPSHEMVVKHRGYHGFGVPTAHARGREGRDRRTGPATPPVRSAMTAHCLNRQRDSATIVRVQCGGSGFQLAGH